MKYASQIPRETIARLEAMAAEDPVRFCQPHPCPGVYSSREDEEFWCYKCWGHALEQPMPGSNLAEFFRQQDLQFPLPAGFREERRITISHGSDCMAVDCKNDCASVWCSCACSANCTDSRFSRVTCRERAERSTNTTDAAPRLNASIPIAPLPANRSRKRASGRYG